MPIAEADTSPMQALIDDAGSESSLRRALTDLQAGRAEAARRRLGDLVDARPDLAAAWALLGIVELQSGEVSPGILAFRRALALEPTNVEFLLNFGLALTEARRRLQAFSYLSRGLALAAGNATAWGAVGNGHLTRNDPRRALAYFRHCLALSPAETVVLVNLALAELSVDAVPSANSHARRGLAASGGRAGRTEWALSLVAAAAYDDASRVFAGDAPAREAYRRRFLSDSRLDGQEAATSTSQLRHDSMQLRRLLRHRLVPDELGRSAHVLDEILRACGEPGHRMISVDPKLQATLADAYRSLSFVSPAGASRPRVLNPTLDIAGIETKYRRSGVVVIDDLLTPEALDSLYRYCLDTTMWTLGVTRAYVMALLQDGLACPLLLQIAHELPLRLPSIVKGCQLRQAWAFKYDSAAPGTDLHADEAAVNVNFWITPDAANLDPSSGGLVVYDKEAPLDWDFAHYNGNQPAIRSFLESSGARAIRVPYRQNRAVVFNSNLFHRTDDFNFRPEYENRRINVTLLYGFRGPPPQN